MVPSFTGLVDEDRPRVHVYVPLAEPCPRDRHPGAYESFARSLGVSHDVRCKNPARRFYFGQSLGPVVFDRNNGEGLNWRELGEPVPSGAEIIQFACADPVPTKTDLRKVLNRWEKKGGEKGRAVAGRIKLMLLGHSYADKGERHTVNLQMTSWLAREYPRVDPGAFADRLAEPAWLEMYDLAADVQMARDRWVTMWNGQVAKLGEEKRAVAARRASTMADRVQRARYGHTSEPYSGEELEAMAAWLGITVELLPRYAVCQLGRGFWLLGLDREGKPSFRGPRGGVDIVEAARDLLSPFGGLVSVESFDDTTGKPRLMSKSELMHQYGFTIESTSGVLYGEPGLRIEQGSMRLRYARLEPSEAVWHEDVDQWLRKFAGASYEALCDWLAVVTNLEEAAPALWMIGPPGSGKSLLAMGVASIWGPGAEPVKGNELNQFNAELLQCPVVDFAENLGMSLDTFKDFVTSSGRRIEPKGVDKFPVSGALRIMLSSNHENSLKTRRALTRADLEALADRMIVVRVPEDCGRLPKGVAQKWLGGAFREHFTWLRENRQVQEADRLACRPYSDGVVDRLMDGNQPLQQAAALVVKAARGQVGFMSEGAALYYHARKDLILMKVQELVDMSEGKFTVRTLADALGAVGYERSRTMRVRITKDDPRWKKARGIRSGPAKGMRDTNARYATIPKEGFLHLCDMVEQAWEDVLPTLEKEYVGPDEIPLPAE